VGKTLEDAEESVVLNSLLKSVLRANWRVFSLSLFRALSLALTLYSAPRSS